jgi:hypothetical protein
VASIIHQFTAVVPANTAKATPYVYKMQLPTEQIDTVDLEVPPGPQGLMGFYLAYSNQQIIPFEAGQYIVWDDYRDTWELDDYPTAGSWSIVGYNLDAANSHEVVVRFHDDQVAAPTVPSIQINITSTVSSDVVTL